MATTKSAPTRKTAADPATEPKSKGRPGTAEQASIQTSARTRIRIEHAIPEPSSPSPERRQRMIQDAAYFRAERRSFGPGDPVQDWIEAEAEIDRQQPGQEAEAH